MVNGNRNDWQVHVYGDQRDELELDLLAQIVIMLGHQLTRGTLAADDQLPDMDSHS